MSWRPSAIDEALALLPPALQIEALQAMADHVASPEYQAAQHRCLELIRAVGRAAAQRTEQALYAIVTGQAVPPGHVIEPWRSRPRPLVASLREISDG